MKLRSTALVKGFRQSAPYVNAHHNKTMVFLLSGETLADGNFTNIVNDIALLNSLGIRLVLVYGARPQITDLMLRQHQEPQYHKGVRITGSDALETIKQAAGQLQLDITARLSMSLNNTPMAGAQINVVSGNFIIAQPLGVDDGVDYCHSGRIRRIDVEGISSQLDQGSIVLLGPVASSVTGECFNLSSEEVATQLAIRLHADKLIGFSAEQGVTDHNGRVVSELFPQQAEELLATEHGGCGAAAAGFLRCAVAASYAGVPRCHLLSYKVDGSLIQELFSMEGIGTQIVTESAEKIRQADIDDIGGILDLIRPLEQQGSLVRRSREQLEQEIARFSVVERDGRIIGCAALYPFPDEAIGEMACVAVHPEYRDGQRGRQLLSHISHLARKTGLKKIFVLTTRSVHWFREQGFTESDVNSLPDSKQMLYNLQRRSKVLTLNLANRPATQIAR
ncbi:amino-acid N-acetyltransferase [Veronia pacifica]|uniref:Amino-acid acetyltransferase n=1 Tax=Veronia pacifica TaxID=1080227 RepID=A0A1C3EI43_9GAMM|nr:amino-acid N-acetyltransferase [Veronia pacifica]ODA32906.1 amino-acid N-acetyltransferase [Veronia pacifica]